MRLATWNLNHRAARRMIPGWVSSALAAQAPDVVVLTEYVVGPSHGMFVQELAASGLAHVSVTDPVHRENQLLIASREAHSRRTTVVPDIHKSVGPNVLEVVLERSGVTVLGFRMPAYAGTEARLKRPTWDWMLERAADLMTRVAVITGDFNTAFGDSRARCGDCLESLQASGWQRGTPTSGESWRHPRSGTGRAIDHLFLTTAVDLESATYSWDFERLRSGGPAVVGTPDHAMLLASISPRHA